MQVTFDKTYRLFYLHSIRLLYSSKEPVSLFVFEDATTHGYGLSAGPLNYEGTKFVLKRLAKFHAASVYLDREVWKKKAFFDKILLCVVVY